ncbi:MAG: hypothetical protein ACRDSF_25095, partial [Pseudonocardiaceae bacterium]
MDVEAVRASRVGHLPDLPCPGQVELVVGAREAVLREAAALTGREAAQHHLFTGTELSDDLGSLTGRLSDPIEPFRYGEQAAVGADQVNGRPSVNPTLNDRALAALSTR